MESRANCAELRVTWTVTQGKRTENALFRDVACAPIQLILRESGLLYLSVQPCLQTIVADFRCDFPVDTVLLHEDLDHLHETKKTTEAKLSVQIAVIIPSHPPMSAGNSRKSAIVTCQSPKLQSPVATMFSGLTWIKFGCCEQRIAICEKFI